MSHVAHRVTDSAYVRAVRLGARTIRAVCGHKVHPSALATPPSDVACPACAGRLAADELAS